jgi:hypothetical protein
MPTIGGIGLAPLAQWFILPVVALTIVRHRHRHRANS